MNVTESFRAFADCLREPAILVSTVGDVVAMNAAAGTLLGVAPLAHSLNFRLADFLHGGGAALDDFIRACSRTRQPIFASLALRSPSGDAHPYRAEGLLYQSAGHNQPATVFLRLMPREAASAPLVALDERLRVFARGHSGRPRYVAINELVASAAAVLRPLVGDEIELVTRLTPDAPMVRVDPSKLERVLVNLAVHAREVMPRGGRLTFETGARGAAGDIATIAIRDTGPRLSDEERAGIFEPFVASGHHSDSAMSLASCRTTLNDLGGEIEVESGAAGTTFTVTLPAAEGPDGQPEPPAESITVLVVDDDDTTRDLIADSLQSVGFKVLSASDGPAAVEIAKAHGSTINLLVTDVVMPRLTGPRVAQLLRQSAPRMRVLYVSGYTDRVDLPPDTPESRSAFLAKPFTRGTLVGRVQALLDA